MYRIAPRGREAVLAGLGTANRSGVHPRDRFETRSVSIVIPAKECPATRFVVAAFAAALAASAFRPARPSRAQALCSLLGGLHRGWGATSGLGCSVCTLLSGIMAGAVSGWVFGAAMFAGLTATLLTGRRLVLLP